MMGTYPPKDWKGWALMAVALVVILLLGTFYFIPHARAETTPQRPACSSVDAPCHYEHPRFTRHRANRFEAGHIRRTHSVAAVLDHRSERILKRTYRNQMARTTIGRCCGVDAWWDDFKRRTSCAVWKARSAAGYGNSCATTSQNAQVRNLNTAIHDVAETKEAHVIWYCGGETMIGFATKPVFGWYGAGVGISHCLWGAYGDSWYPFD